MRISEYPPEELQEWLDLPATKGFVEELQYLRTIIQGEYIIGVSDHDLWLNQGKERGIKEVLDLIKSLGEGL